jgi:hypothetical protein
MSPAQHAATLSEHGAPGDEQLDARQSSCIVPG